MFVATGTHRAARAQPVQARESGSPMRTSAYTDLGADYVDRLDSEQLQHRYVQRLEQVGYTVILTPVPAA